MADVYDAGAVRAAADINRDPFVEGLRYCLEQGRAFARMKFTATADVDTRAARAELARLQIMMRRISEESVDIDVNVQGATAAKVEIQRLRTEQAAYRAEMERSKVAQQAYRAEQERSKTSTQALRVEQERARTTTQQARADVERARLAQQQYANEVRRTSSTVNSSSSTQVKKFTLIRNAIEQLGPPLVPFAGGLLAATTAVIGLGSAGILAFKGIQNEMKAGTPIGLEYASGVRTIKGDLTALEKTAAGGVLTGFDQSVGKIQARLPAFNASVGESSVKLGDIAQHLIGGLVGGFETFNPLIQKSEGYLDSLASKFESWATGPGGAHFAETLSEDLDHMAPALANLSTLIGHLFSALNDAGNPMLDTISALAKTLDALPVGVLTALLDTYLTFRTIGLATSAINAASKALRGFAVAETEAAAAQGAAGGAGAAGAATGTLGRIGTFARRATLGAVGAYVGAGFADSATKDWQTSTNDTQRILGETAHTLNNLVHFRFNKIVPDITGDNAAAQNSKDMQAGVYAATHRSGQSGSIFGTAGVGGSNLAYQPGGSGTTYRGVTAGQGSVAPRAAGNIANNLSPGTGVAALGAAGALHGLTNAEEEARVKGQQLATVNKQIMSSLGLVQQQAARGDLNTAATAYNNLSTSLGKSVVTQQKWLDQGGKTVATIDGVKIGEGTLSAALKETNGDYTQAVGLIQGRIAGLKSTQSSLAASEEREKRLGDAVDYASKKYNLSADQVDLYARTVGVSSEAVADGTVTAQQFGGMIAQVNTIVTQGNTAVTGYVTALQQFQAGADTAATRGQLLAATMVALNGDTLSYQTSMAGAAVANQQFVTDFNKAAKGVVNLKTGMIDFHNAGAAPLLNDLTQLQAGAAAAAAAVFQHEESTKGATQAAKDAANVYYNDTHGALVAEHTQLGITRTEADKLADRYFHWPKDAKTQIEAMGATGTNRLLNQIGLILAKLAHTKWTFGVDAKITPSAQRVLNTVAGHQGGGTSIKASTQAYGAIYYAGGGMEDHSPQVHAPTYRVFAEPETGGEAYIPMAPDSRRPRAKSLVQQVAAKFGGVAYFAEGGGFTGVTGGSGSSSGKSGSGGASASANASLLSQLKTLYNTVTKNRIGSETIAQLDKESTASLTSWATSLLADAQRAHDKLKATPSSLVARVKKENKALSDELRVRDTLATRRAAIDAKVAGDRANIAQEKSTVAGAITGGFDIGTSGNGYAAGIASTLHQSVADASKFESLRQKAKALGLNAALLRQITEEGPATGGANLEAIVGGGKSYVSGINADYSKLTTIANRVGAAQGSDTYGKQLAADVRTQTAIAREQTAEQKKINKTLSGLRSDLTKLEHTIVEAERQKSGHR